MKQQDLTVVGLTKDKQKLVLVSDAGEEFTLPVDQKLRSALRGEATRLGQLEITMESTLRPRDIQARIRAGESPEDVAAAAQTTLDRIMGYATPVLAERAHIADRAQRASVRRKSGDGPGRLLGDAVAEQLRSRNVDPESVDWDAWRREDGRWTLVADYRSGDHGRSRAEFLFDAPGRYVVPEDDEARRLVGELAAARESRPRPESSRRLSAVGTDEELPLGEDAIGMVTAPEAEPAAEETTVDLTSTARTVRETDRVPDPAAPTADADWMATQATERPARPQPEPQPEPRQPEQRAPEPEPEPEPQQPEQRAPEPEPEPEPQQPSRRPVKKTKGRASVPSWDEIMFGGGRSE